MLLYHLIHSNGCRPLTSCGGYAIIMDSASYIHYIKGALTSATNNTSKQLYERLIGLMQSSGAAIYVDTIISPSFKTAVAQLIQIPGISGMENNSILFEYLEDDDKDIADIIEGCQFAGIVNFNIAILRCSERRFRI